MVTIEEVMQSNRVLVRKVAADFHHKFSYVQRDDIEQELWIWHMKHVPSALLWSHLPREDQDKVFGTSLRREALDYCQKERKIVEGYFPEDHYKYSKVLIKRLIPQALSENIEQAVVGGDLSGVGASNLANETGNWMAFLVDIRRAFEVLKERDRTAVYLFYVAGYNGDELAEAIGSPSANAATKFAGHAVDRMAKYLNRPVRNIDDDFFEVEYPEYDELIETTQEEEDDDR